MFRTKLSSGPSEGHIVISLHGELDLVDAAAVAAALGALAERDRWIIVDLSRLEFIDAAGVGALSRGRRQARNVGGGLLLTAPQPRVQQVLSLIWHADGSGVEATMAAAVASAGSPPLRQARRSGGSLLGSAGRASP